MAPKVSPDASYPVVESLSSVRREGGRRQPADGRVGRALRRALRPPHSPALLLLSSDPNAAS